MLLTTLLSLPSQQNSFYTYLFVNWIGDIIPFYNLPSIIIKNMWDDQFYLPGKLSLRINLPRTLCDLIGFQSGSFLKKDN